MEFKRDSVIGLYLAGRLQVAILRAPQHLHVNKSFVSSAIALYCDTGSVASRPKSGRKKMVITPKMIRKVKVIFDRNPRRSGRRKTHFGSRTLNRTQHHRT